VSESFSDRRAVGWKLRGHDQPADLPTGCGQPDSNPRSRRHKYLHVDASDDSSPILRRLGFLAVTTTTPYVHKPAEDGAKTAR
jgi:hypothetical protein